MEEKKWWKANGRLEVVGTPLDPQNGSFGAPIKDQILD